GVGAGARDAAVRSAGGRCGADDGGAGAARLCRADPAGAGEREGGGGGGGGEGARGAVRLDGAHGEPRGGGGCAGAVSGGAPRGGGADPRGAVGGRGGVDAERQGERGDRVPAGRARCAGGDAAV